MRASCPLVRTTKKKQTTPYANYMVVKKENFYSRISTRSWLGVLGVAGTLLAFLLKHVVWQRCIGGSSFRNGPASSRTSLSVLPVYLNLYPHEKMDPPLTTGASDALGKLRTHRAVKKLLVTLHTCALRYRAIVNQQLVLNIYLKRTTLKTNSN